MRIKSRLFLALSLVSIIPLLVVGVLACVIVRQNNTEENLNYLRSVADIQANRIETAIRENREKLNLVTRRTASLSSLDRFLSNKNTADLEIIRRTLDLAKSSVASFKDISVLGVDGTVLASTNDSEVGRIKTGEAYFKRGLTDDVVDTLLPGADGGVTARYSVDLERDGRISSSFHR